MPMLVHGKRGLLFKCSDLTCLLNDKFNVVLFGECAAVRDGKAHAVGFSVPVRYLDFIKTVSVKHTLKTAVTEIFTFERPEDAQKLSEFVSKQPELGVHQAIPFLFPKKTKESTLPFIRRAL